MISQHADDVIVLWITYSVNIDRQGGVSFGQFVFRKNIFLWS